MLLLEAKAEINERLKMHDEYKEHIPEYFEALEIAVKCIEAQQRLCDMLNDFWIGLKEDDTFTARLTEDMLMGIRYDAKFDDDGMFIREDEEE